MNPDLRADASANDAVARENRPLKPTCNVVDSSSSPLQQYSVVTRSRLPLIARPSRSKSTCDYDEDGCSRVSPRT